MAAFTWVACSRPAAPREKPLSEVLAGDQVPIPQSDNEDPVVITALVVPKEYRGIPTGITPENRPYLGAANPVVTVTVFTDFQCPYCSMAHARILERIQNHPDAIRLVLAHFPLPFHRHAFTHALYAFCAAQQDRAWHVLDDLYDARNRGIHARSFVRRHALDPNRFSACIHAPESIQAIKNEVEEGKKLGVNGTPTFFIDGVRMNLTEVEIYLEEKLRRLPRAPKIQTLP